MFVLTNWQHVQASNPVFMAHQLVHPVELLPHKHMYLVVIQPTEKDGLVHHGEDVAVEG